MKPEDIKVGLRVRVGKLGSTEGMLINYRRLNGRLEGATGMVKHAVPGHGGEVWIIEQDDGNVSAYSYLELEHEPKVRSAATNIPDSPPVWVSVDDVLKVIRDPRWIWAANSPCKYIQLRLDTRDGHCLIYDRDNNEITLRELSRQFDEYLLDKPQEEGRPCETSELHDADPDCKHMVVEARGGGIKCTKCKGWFCF